MSKGRPEATTSRIEASTDALKLIYYLVIGLAITEALGRAFLQDGRFLSFGVFDTAHLPASVLLLVFLVTSSRFVHGASIHLQDIRTGRAKALFDFFGFFLQALLFYVMALSLHDPRAFLLCFFVLLVADALWLLVLCRLGYLRFGGTAKQWMGSDLVIILLLLGIAYVDPGVGIGSVVVVAFGSTIALVADYAMNFSFYFPSDGAPA